MLTEAGSSQLATRIAEMQSEATTQLAAAGAAYSKILLQQSRSAASQNQQQDRGFWEALLQGLRQVLSEAFPASRLGEQQHAAVQAQLDQQFRCV